jgi:hypothetical protein
MRRKTEVIGLTAIAGGIVLMAALMGCTTTTLDPSGVYAGNMFLYQCDKTLVTAKDTLDNVVTWEMQNRAQLATNHLQSVTAAADAIRAEAPTWFGTAAAARAAYTNLLFSVGTPPATLTASSNALAVSVASVQLQATAAQTIQSVATNAPAAATK